MSYVSRYIHTRHVVAPPVRLYIVICHTATYSHLVGGTLSPS